MKVLRISWLLAIPAVIAFSCSSDEGMTKADNCLITSIDVITSSVITSSYTGEEFTSQFQNDITLSYDGDVITSILDSHDYERYSSGESESWSYKIDFEYEGGSISGIQKYFVDTDSAVMEEAQIDFELVDGSLTIERHTGETGGMSEFRYKYDEVGQLIALEEWNNYSDFNEGLKIKYKTQYTNENGNIVTKERLWFDEDSQTWRSQGVAEFSYSEQENPFYNNLAIYLVIDSPELAFFDFPEMVFSKNALSTYEVEFNEQGYPMTYKYATDFLSINIDMNYSCY